MPARDGKITVSSKTYEIPANATIDVFIGQRVVVGATLYKGEITNNVFHIDMCRISLLVLLLALCLLIYKAKKHNFKNI